jgi:hypothetical protein
MPSSVRTPVPSQPQTSSTVSPLKRKAMSITQTYYLAHTARGKLSSEAARADHNLRLLVGHANLLDSLMLELAEAEQEQESWFNQSVRAATKPVETPKHIQWADSIVEEPEQDWQAEDADSSDSDSDSEFDEEEDIEMASAGIVALNRVQSQQPLYMDESDEEFEEDDEEDYASLSLARTPSRSAQPPELSNDSDDSSSDDESMPPSPPSTTLNFSEKQRQQIATTSFYESQSQKLSPTEQASFFDDGFYLPQRPETSLISAISVY